MGAKNLCYASRQVLLCEILRLRRLRLRMTGAPNDKCTHSRGLLGIPQDLCYNEGV